MRKRVSKNGFSVHAIAGCHTVLLGFNITDPKAKAGLLGFAIKRYDAAEDESVWLHGRKTFSEEYGGTKSGMSISTRKAPVQGFLWGDYDAVMPGQQYTYHVYPVYGTPDEMSYEQPISVDITTESESDHEHAIYFNRGIAGSQGYANKFFNLPIDEIGEPAFKWLSRGLFEGMIDFINQAKDGRYSIRATVYEFNYLPVLKAFRAALDRGVDVKIIFDNKKSSSGPGKENLKAIKLSDLEKVCLPRTANTSYISHNKVIILLKDDEPIEVWTGSTNITEGGIFGHANVGHIVRDKTIAKRYMDFWDLLEGDPEAKQLRPNNEAISPEPEPEPTGHYVAPIFSPRTNLDALDLYSEKMEDAKQAVFLTAAFGLNDQFKSILEEDKKYLRYILLDKPGKGLDLINRDHDNRIAVGSVMNDNNAQAWLNEKWKAEKLTGLNEHVQYVHTKFMLVDPLTENPLVITGSANFSVNSTKNNDENMLVIRGNKRVADIYMCEFMRIFNHYYSRSYHNLEQIDKKTGEPKSLHLSPNDSWLQPYFKENHPRYKERLLFA